VRRSSWHLPLPISVSLLYTDTRKSTWPFTHLSLSLSLSVWKNANISPSERANSKFVGACLLVLLCIFNTVPLFLVAGLANLPQLSSSVAFLGDWKSAGQWGEWTFSTVAGVLVRFQERSFAPDDRFELTLTILLAASASHRFGCLRAAPALDDSKAHQISRSCASSAFHFGSNCSSRLTAIPTSSSFLFRCCRRPDQRRTERFSPGYSPSSSSPSSLSSLFYPSSSPSSSVSSMISRRRRALRLSYRICRVR
jgi:hypothetical protein